MITSTVQSLLREDGISVSPYSDSDSDSQNTLETTWKVLTVNAGQHTLETMLECMKPFFLQKKFVFGSSWFSWKIAFLLFLLYNSKDVHKCGLPKKVLMVELGHNKPKSMLEQYQTFISAKKICFQLFLVFLENCISVRIAVQLIGRAQM